jgi:imidazolonepropionase-like amidohydrolase
MDHLIGSITVGKKADLVAVNGNVEHDVQKLRSIRTVMKDGVIYRHSLRVAEVDMPHHQNR